MKKSKLKAKIEELEFKNNQLLKDNSYLIKNNAELKKDIYLLIDEPESKEAEMTGLQYIFHRSFVKQKYTVLTMGSINIKPLGHGLRNKITKKNIDE
jgi:predicted AAA+ superfamily ATPase